MAGSAIGLQMQMKTFEGPINVIMDKFNSWAKNKYIADTKIQATGKGSFLVVVVYGEKG